MLRLCLCCFDSAMRPLSRDCCPQIPQIVAFDHCHPNVTPKSLSCDLCPQTASCDHCPLNGVHNRCPVTVAHRSPRPCRSAIAPRPLFCRPLSPDHYPRTVAFRPGPRTSVPERCPELLSLDRCPATVAPQPVVPCPLPPPLSSRPLSHDRCLHDFCPPSVIP